MKLQLKRSNVLEGGFAKAPTAVQMEYGELAVNYNVTDACLFIKDSDNNIVRISNAGIPVTGDVTFQPGTLDERYVMQSGSTMTGALVLSGDPTDALGAATKQYVDSLDVAAAPDIQDSPPENPTSGQFWWDSSDGRLYIYYQDFDSAQWVPATPSTAIDLTVLPVLP